MSAQLQLLTAIYTALNGSTTFPVYAAGNVPDNTIGLFAVVGEMTATAHDADGQIGSDITATLHVWDTRSEYRGFDSVLGATTEIETILNRADLTTAGYNFLGIDKEFDQCIIDSDGVTPHAIQRYRSILTKQ